MDLSACLPVAVYITGSQLTKPQRSRWLAPALHGMCLHDCLLCWRQGSLQPLQRLQRSALHVICDRWCRVRQGQKAELQAMAAPVIEEQQKLFQRLQASGSS